MTRRYLTLAALFLFCTSTVALSTPPRPASNPPLVTASTSSQYVWEPVREAQNTRIWNESMWMLSEASKLEGNTRAMAEQEARQGGSHRGYGSVEACIAAVENGGDYGRSSNPTHFGKYQFSQGTWAANGGNPNTWGYASPEEQETVFRATVERNGYRDWTPYDGCG